MAVTYNGQSVSLAESKELRDAREFYWEVKGQDAAEFRLTEEGQEDPKGRFRTRVEGDVWMLQKKTEAPDTWKTYITLDSEGLFLEPLNTSQSELLEAMWQYLKEIREVLEWAVEGNSEHE